MPQPGMFFGPLYPLLIAGMTTIDGRFDRSVDCAVETAHGARPGTECEIDVRPMLIVHALLLALGILAVARSAEGILRTGDFLARRCVGERRPAGRSRRVLVPDDREPTFSLYSLTMLAIVMGWTTSTRRYFAMAGLGLGLLCLTRFSFLALAPVIPVLILLHGRFAGRPRRGWAGVLTFAVAFLAVVIPWAARNAISVGKLALTEEYGSAALVERFAFDRMTAREFLLAFPYCIPEVGPRVVQSAFGADAMTRFQYDLPDSFYLIGSGQRWALIAAHKRLDPIIGALARTEMRENGWRYLLVGVPLAWCGMWVGGWLSILLAPLFAGACAAAFRTSKPAFLLYAAPALVMLALHAALASHYTRYNLILIGPFSAGAAWLMVSIGARACAIWRIPRPHGDFISDDFVFDHCANGQQLKCLTVTDEFTKEGLGSMSTDAFALRA